MKALEGSIIELKKPFYIKYQLCIRITSVIVIIGIIVGLLASFVFQTK